MTPNEDLLETTLEALHPDTTAGELATALDDIMLMMVECTCELDIWVESLPKHYHYLRALRDALYEQASQSSSN